MVHLVGGFSSASPFTGIGFGMMSYQGYEVWKQWAEASFGAWSEADDAYFSCELERAGVDLFQGGRVYEIGFGNGAFAGFVVSKGADYLGSELNSTLVDRAKMQGLRAMEGGIEEVLSVEGPASFDAVVAFDVLEHLGVCDIRSFLLDAFSLLRPGGLMLARVPSGDSPFGRAVLHGDITHRTALGSSAIGQLASQTGFEVASIGPPALPVFGLGLRRMTRRGAVRLAQAMVGWFINAVFHDGQPRVITANLVFVLRKPVKTETPC